MKLTIPKAHFGHADNEPINWRKVKQEADVDDEELAKTPDDVLKILGFDPKQIKQIKQLKRRK